MEIIVETQSGSQYQISRESGSPNSKFLVRKIEGNNDNKYTCLILVGHIREVEPTGISGKGVPFAGKAVYCKSIGFLPDSIDRNPNVLVGNKLFFKNCKLDEVDYIQRLLISSTEDAVKTGNSKGVPLDFAQALGNSTNITRIVSIR